MKIKRQLLITAILAGAASVPALISEVPIRHVSAQAASVGSKIVTTTTTTHHLDYPSTDHCVTGEYEEFDDPYYGGTDHCVTDEYWESEDPHYGGTDHCVTGEYWGSDDPYYGGTSHCLSGEYWGSDDPYYGGTDHCVTGEYEDPGTTITTTLSGYTEGTHYCNGSMWINEMPEKTVYQIGEELDLTGGIFSGCGEFYENGAGPFNWDIFTESMTDYIGTTVDISQFDSSKPGIYTIYIQYEDAKTSFVVEVIGKSPVKGDADGNGKVDVCDAVLLARIAADDPDLYLTPQERLNADLDGNGMIDKDDLIAVLSILEDKDRLRAVNGLLANK